MIKVNSVGPGASLIAAAFVLASSAAPPRATAQTASPQPPSSPRPPPSSVAPGTAAPAPTGTPSMVPVQGDAGLTLNLDIVAQQLNAARIAIEPTIGASTYTMSQPAIQDLPGGANTPIDDAILQMPGVDQDNAANGGLHVRNEHLNVQYRIDGVIIPDGVSFFGQDLSTRFVQSMELITGALPAEYGLRTAGIVDIQTKSGLRPGGSVTMYGGSHGTVNPSFEYGTSVDGYDLYFSGDYLKTEQGVNSVTPKYNQIRDFTWQTHDFFCLDKIIDANDKVSVMAGEFNSNFQIPNNPSQPTLTGITAIHGTPISAFNSAGLAEHQDEGSQVGAVSYLHTSALLDFQVSAITKYSSIDYYPDLLGDLVFNGIGQSADRTSWANNLQTEGTYRLTPDHTLRAGILLEEEHVTANTSSDVLPQIGTDANGNPIYGTTTETIDEATSKTSLNYSTYLQDEWKALPNVTVNYGGRFDLVNGYTIGNQLSPRINTVWRATQATTVHAGYASYFTPPPQELVSAGSLAPFANTSAAPQVPLNSPMKNESAQYFDTGVIQTLLPGLKGGVDLYYKFADNLIDEGQFGAPVILTPFNYRHGINRGIELTANYNRGPFTFYGNLAIAVQVAKGIESAQFNFTEAQLLSADSFYVHTDHSQLYTASAGTAYLWWGTRFAVDIVAGSGLRSQPADDPAYNGETVPSYEQLNLTISHRFDQVCGGPIDLRLAIINLFDEVYLLRSQTGVGVFANQYGPRRSIYAGVTKEF